jgi:hypothetical protein
MAINTEAPRVLAEEAKRTRALLVHYRLTMSLMVQRVSLGLRPTRGTRLV